MRFKVENRLMRNAVLGLALILGTSSLGADLIEGPSTKTANVLTLELEGRLVRIYTTRNIAELQKYLKTYKGPSATYDDLIRALEAMPSELVDEEAALRDLPPCPLGALPVALPKPSPLAAPTPPLHPAKPPRTNRLQGPWVWVSMLGPVLGMVGV